MSMSYQPHGLNFNYLPHSELLRLADVAKCMDAVPDEWLRDTIAENAAKPDGLWELLHAARALLVAEGLR